MSLTGRVSFTGSVRPFSPRVFLWALGFWAGTAMAAETGPVQGLERFFAVYHNMEQGGVPVAFDRARLMPVVTPGLMRDLTLAAGAEAAVSAVRREPPLVEGDLWVSLFEGARHEDIVNCDQYGDSAACLVRLSTPISPVPGDEAPAGGAGSGKTGPEGTGTPPVPPEKSGASNPMAPKDAEIAVWEDRYLLHRMHGVWMVDDVIWGGRWKFARKGSLRKFLADVVAEASEIVAAAGATKP